MKNENVNHLKAAIWILLSPFIFLMAAISKVESWTIYYIQLGVFGAVAILGVATGIGYIFGSPWVEIPARFLLWTLAMVFAGLPALAVLFVIWHKIT